MTESFAERTIRLSLEQRCARAFLEVLAGLPGERTLIVFDYGGGPFCNVAFKTSLQPHALIALLENRVCRWQNNALPVAYDPELHGWQPTEAELVEKADRVKALLPESVGMALFWGEQYAANGAREDMAKMFSDDLLPGLKREFLR